jgi:DNA-binding XRE family transcriptional regulator
MHSFTVDVSDVGDRGVSESLLALIRKHGFGCTRLDRFWHSFSNLAGKPAQGVLVLGDLGALARHYSLVGPHRWVAAVREARPFFIGLVRTRMDRRYVGITEELLRASDMRATICVTPETDFEDCLQKAASALEPDFLLDVRYSPLTRELWVHFGDGLFGSVTLYRLGLHEQMEDLVLQTVTVVDNGAAVEMLRKSGDPFRVDASFLRGALSGSRRCQPALHVRAGDRVRSARIRAGVSQTTLAARTGIHQTRISRIEHGVHRPRLDTLERMARVLGCSVIELLSEE